MRTSRHRPRHSSAVPHRFRPAPRMGAALVLVLLGLTACTVSQKHVRAAALERASFDLDCPEESITTKRLGETNVIGRTPQDVGLERTVIGATGCGQKAVYVVECVGGLGSPSCNAILNADTRRDAAAE